MLTLIAVAVVAAFVYRVMTPEERQRHFRHGVDIAQRIRQFGETELEPFRIALRERTARSYVAPALVAVQVLVFLRMIVASGSLNDPATLVALGASVGP